MTDWPIKTIAECAVDEPYSTQIGPFGSALSSKAYQASGIPLLRGVNVNRGRFHDDDFVFISDEDADRLWKYKSFPEDVLLVHKGTLGQIGLMPKNRKYKRYIMGQSMLRVRCNPELLLPEYLYYWLCSSDGQHYLFSRVSQVGVPQIQKPLTTLREASLPVPPTDEQHTIVSILGSLDNKIELNRRMNSTLEQMAAANFKAWFVDFEPVRVKASGAASFPGMPQDVFDALPVTFVDSELGSIPEGWEVGSIEELCISITSGGTPARKNTEFWDSGAVAWFKTGELHDGPLLDSSEKITESGLANSACKLWKAGTVLFALYASPTVGRLGILTTEGTSNQAAAGLVAKSEYGVLFLVHTLLQARQGLQQIAVGAAQQNINQGVLKSHKTVVPETATASAFTQSVQPLYDLQVSLAIESQSLAETRDALIPKLLSGEVRLRKGEEG